MSRIVCTAIVVCALASAFNDDHSTLSLLQIKAAVYKHSDDFLRLPRHHAYISFNNYAANADLNISSMNESYSNLSAHELAAMVIRASKPSVIFMYGYEHNYMIEEVFLTAVGSRETAPFVLLIRTGDHPFPVWLQDKFKTLKGLRACYVTNLVTPADNVLFHPLPVGVGYMHSSTFNRALSSASEWKSRKNRLLFTPMTLGDGKGGESAEHPSRMRYHDLFRQSRYRDLVDVVDDRLDGSEYLSLLARYKAVLSPPGVGYDCSRTWQTLAVGSVPFVMRNDSFDQRLFKDVGAQEIPPPEKLTPQSLRDVLLKIESPAPFASKLRVSYWLSTWATYLSDELGA